MEASEIIFCNFFMDVDYEEYIHEAYLYIGFDASKDNAYKKKIMGEMGN